MKYMKFTLGPAEAAIHPIDRHIADTAGVRRESLLHLDTMLDGTTVLLYELTGDVGANLSDLEGAEDVIDVEPVAQEGDATYVYLRVDSNENGGAIIDLVQQHALMLDMPIEFTEEGLKTTIVGTEDLLRMVLGELPDAVDMRVEQAGEYLPDRQDLLSPLTERQREVFRMAVERGYYDVPRRATHEDIAEDLDCAPSTVDEHLRKAESQVVTSLMG